MSFQHDNIQPFPESKDQKKAQVTAMFDSIAQRYDLLNSILSLRIHKLWRQKALKTLKKHQANQILDIATGTGDFAIAIRRALPQAKITGIDISSAMLNIAQKKITKLNANIQLLQGDAEKLPFENGEFDAISIGFGVRNFQNLKQGLQECFRVLHSGGILVILEFSNPQNPLVRRLYQWYSQQGIPLIGHWCSGNKKAYEYLHKSAKAFPYGNQFAEILQQIGFSNVIFQELSLGICTLYRAYKN